MVNQWLFYITIDTDIKIINDKPAPESDLEWIDLVGIDRVATSNKKKLILAKVNYNELIVNDSPKVDEDDTPKLDDVESEDSEVDDLKHFIKNYEIIQYSIRNWLFSIRD